MPMTDRDFLRHTIATLAYRVSKTLRGAPDSFATFQPREGCNTPLVIVMHIADLFDWAYTMLKGEPEWKSAGPKAWNEECDRMFIAFKRLDDWLAAEMPIAQPLSRIFQGPVADALTHTGQLAMLRRLSGSPMKGENYFRAEIEMGRIGSEQVPADPKNEFD